MRRPLVPSKIFCFILSALAATAVALPVAAAVPNSYSKGIVQAQEAIANGDFRKAEKTLEQLSKLHGNNPELLAMRGRVLFWQKRYADSIASFKAAQRIKPDPDVARELEKVETAQQLAEARRLAAGNEDARAKAILRRLFDSGRDPYQSGLALARLQMKGKEFWEAQVVLTRMLQRFPNERDLVLLKAQALLGAGQPGDLLTFLNERSETSGNADLLALRGRALMRLQRYAEAGDSFAASLALADDAEVRVEKERAGNALTLQRADQLVAQGKQEEALLLLSSRFEKGGDSYGTGTRLAALYTRTRRHKEAADVYLKLTRQYPKDVELAELYAGALVNDGREEEALNSLNTIPGGGKRPGVAALRGRIFYRQKLYTQAREEYLKALALGAPKQEIQGELDELQALLDYQRFVLLMKARDFGGAQPLLETVAQGPYGREARMLYARSLMGARRYEAALEPARALYRDFPADAEVAALHADALILAGERKEAQKVLDELSPEERESLDAERGDLFYRTRGNWVKLFGAGYSYSGRSDGEQTAGVSASQRLGRVTAVGTALQTKRFGTTDPQLALDLYLSRKPGQNYYGSLSFTLSPGADVLPQNSIGIEVARSLSPVELSAGYTRLNFSGRDANILTTSLLWYLPRTSFVLGEKLYVVPSSSTVMSVTSLRWQPNYRFHTYAAAGFGNSSERIERQGSGDDLQRYLTWSLRAGGEYRFTPAVSVGGEASFESRRDLYDRTGATLFVKYWWP
jgi:YaiO family outer membrane protein